MFRSPPSAHPAPLQPDRREVEGHRGGSQDLVAQLFRVRRVPFRGPVLPRLQVHEADPQLAARVDDPLGVEPFLQEFLESGGLVDAVGAEDGARLGEEALRVDRPVPLDLLEPEPLQAVELVAQVGQARGGFPRVEARLRERGRVEGPHADAAEDLEVEPALPDERVEHADLERALRPAAGKNESILECHGLILLRGEPDAKAGSEILVGAFLRRRD